MLAPHAVDIHGWNLSNYYLTMFHICRTVWWHFSLRQVKLCIGQRKYKQKFMTQGRIDGSTDQASEFTLAHLTPILHFCKIVIKIISLYMLFFQPKVCLSCLVYLLLNYFFFKVKFVFYSHASASSLQDVYHLKCSEDLVEKMISPQIFDTSH